MTTATNYDFVKKELKAGEELSFVKEVPNQELRQVTLGLGWDPAVAGKAIDLDANATLLDENNKVVDIVYFNHQKSNDGSTWSTGDDLTGQNSEDGDDEQIIVNLDKVASNVKQIIFSVSSYSGQTFEDVSRSYVRLVDTTDGREVELANVELVGKKTGIIASKLVREGSSFWKFVAINKETSAKTVADINKDLEFLLPNNLV